MRPSEKTKLHLVAFDIPYPPDYGGAIDLFYKIKYLFEAGAEIYLHCYEYGRQRSAELEKYCKEVWYYPRKTGLAGLSFTSPYIVYSRRNDELLKRLQEIEAPILFEGVHTSYYHRHSSLKDRFKAIRNHNVEHDYYRQLSAKEKNVLKKVFFNVESFLLKKYERSLKNIQGFYPLSMEDDKYFHGLYPNAKHSFIAPFHPYEDINIVPGTGQYCLYHGNLSHPENKEAAMFLLKEVIPHSPMPFIIAGRNPSKDIINAAGHLAECTLIPNPSSREMNDLIKNAHINVLPTFQRSGMKLKLLYAMFCGRHLIVNEDTLYGTGLGNTREIANTAKDILNKISELKSKPFLENNIQARAAELMKDYNNRNNASRLLAAFQR